MEGGDWALGGESLVAQSWAFEAFVVGLRDGFFVCGSVRPFSGSRAVVVCCRGVVYW